MCNFCKFGKWPSWFSSRASRPMGLLFEASNLLIATYNWPLSFHVPSTIPHRHPHPPPPIYSIICDRVWPCAFVGRQCYMKERHPRKGRHGICMRPPPHPAPTPNPPLHTPTPLLWGERSRFLSEFWYFEASKLIATYNIHTAPLNLPNFNITNIFATTNWQALKSIASFIDRCMKLRI